MEKMHLKNFPHMQKNRCTLRFLNYATKFRSICRIALQIVSASAGFRTEILLLINWNVRHWLNA
jgi:hypothetical protein